MIIGISVRPGVSEPTCCILSGPAESTVAVPVAVPALRHACNHAPPPLSIRTVAARLAGIDWTGGSACCVLCVCRRQDQPFGSSAGIFASFDLYFDPKHKIMRRPIITLVLGLCLLSVALGEWGFGDGSIHYTNLIQRYEMR